MSLTIKKLATTYPTFTNRQELGIKLKELGYVGFLHEAEVLIADLISTDADNIIELGTDGKLFAESSGSSSNEYFQAVTVHAEASSYYSTVNYPVMAIGRLDIPTVTDFTFDHWLSLNGTTTNQVVNLYFEKGVTPEFMTYINGGSAATSSKGGSKNTMIYGMTNQVKALARNYTLDFANVDTDLTLLFDATGTTETDGNTGTGYLKPHNIDQYEARNERLELATGQPLIYGISLYIADRFTDNYISLKRFRVWHR